MSSKKIDNHYIKLIPPYVPFASNGPCITMQTAISRINGYCSKLSDKTVLVPRWTEEEICRDAVNPDWLDKINAAMELYPPSKKLYRVHLLLPLSSPLREEIVGPALPSKLYAKRAVALEACKKLHQLGELDNVHLLPITQVDQLEDEPIDEEANCTDSSLGTSKRKQIYRKEIAKAFSDCLPQAGQDCYIYQLNFKLINSARDETTTCYLSDAGNKFAILTSNCLPTICPIPLVTRAGEMTVEVVGVDSVVLNFEQLEKLKRFHQHLVEDVMLLFKTREDFDFENPTLGLLIVPVKQEDSSVDFELVNRILASPPINWDAREREFYWDPARYVDAVITPWYTDPEERTIYYVDAVTGMTPLDTFPNEKFSNYASYYQSKYQLTVTDMSQQLLQVSREISGRNYLLRRTITKKENVFHLIPEFCVIHALPASLWKQVVRIPCFLERLNRLLVAEELRIRIAIGVGFFYVPLGCFWPSLRRDHFIKVDQEEPLEDRSFDDCARSKLCPGPGPGFILEALTLEQTNEGFQMERLQTIGESVLKLITSIFLYGQHSGNHCTGELLKMLQMRQNSSRNLYRLGRKAGLGSKIVAKAFHLKSNFLPPCVSLVGEHNSNRLDQIVSDKNIADCVRALTGAYLLASGVAGAMKFLKWIGLNTIPDDLVNNLNPMNGLPRLAACGRLPSPPNGEEMLIHLFSGLERLEDTINYKFKDKTLLIEALSHSSYFPNRLTVSYERLKFLGDAVLEYLVTKFFFDENKYSPADFTELREAMEINATFALLAVRHSFHTFVKHESPHLKYWLNKVIQNDCNHQLFDDYFLSDNEKANEELACDAVVPKILGGIFCSVAGAILIDSGMSLDTVWRSYYPLLHEEIDEFRRNIPESPIRTLYKNYPGIVITSVDLPDGRVYVEVKIKGNSYVGVRRTYCAAKCAAAKRALGNLKI